MIIDDDDDDDTAWAEFSCNTIISFDVYMFILD